jgi:predicted dinucleotide-binding enzyme
VKAFNTIFAELLPTESRAGRKVQVFIAGDDETAKAKVEDLVMAAEFEPLDSGILEQPLPRTARRVEYLVRLLSRLGNHWRTGISKELILSWRAYRCLGLHPSTSTFGAGPPHVGR